MTSDHTKGFNDTCAVYLLSGYIHICCADTQREGRRGPHKGVLTGRVVWRWSAVSRGLHLKGCAPAGLHELRQQRSPIADHGPPVGEQEMLELKLLQ